MPGILVFIIVLIIHLSLYPWHFQPLSPGAGALAILIHSWPSLDSRRILFDAAANVIFYLPLGVTAYLSLARRRFRWIAFAGPLLLAFVLSVVLEMAQSYVPTRVTSASDVVANLCGATLGVAAGRLIERFYWPFKPAMPAGAPSGGLLLMIWVGYQLFPLMPDLHLAALLNKIHGLAGISIPLLPLFVSVAQWVAVDALVRFLAGARRGLASAVFFLLLLLVPARIMIITRTATWPELAALPLALMFRWIAGEKGWGQRAAAVLIGAAVVLNGLAPFRFGPAAPFHWMPFEWLLTGNWLTSGSLLLLKAFRYGALVWLLRARGLRLMTAGAFTAAVLAAIEAAQVYLPVHNPEISDPLLALILLLAMFVVERRWAVSAAR